MDRSECNDRGGEGKMKEPERTADDVLRSNECNTYVMSCHLSSPDLYKAMRQDLRIACAEIARLRADADRLADAMRTNIKDIGDYVDDGSDLTGTEDDMPYFRASAALERIRAALKAHEELGGRA